MARDEDLQSEAQRVATLRRFVVLDTPPENVFDRVTALVAKLFDVPMAFIALVDERRQWLKSKVGVEGSETDRALAFCNHAIRSDEVTVVPDTALDPRFHDNPLVLGGPKIRFYAGAPLIASDGMRIGTVCVLDRIPRTLDRTQLGILQEISSFVMAHLELRLEMLATAAAKNELAAVIDASPNAIITGLVDGTITGWNRAATNVFGWTAGEVIGRAHSFVPPEFNDEAQRLRTRIIDDGEIVTNMRAIGLHKSGRRLELAFSAKPIHALSGHAISAAYVVEDVTESKRQKEIERRRYEILELAANDGPLQEILDRLVQSIEYSIPESIGSILRLRGDRLKGLLDVVDAAEGRCRIHEVVVVELRHAEQLQHRRVAGRRKQRGVGLGDRVFVLAGAHQRIDRVGVDPAGLARDRLLFLALHDGLPVEAQMECIEGGYGL